MEEIWHEGGRLIDGLKWSSRADGAYLHMPIFKVELEGRAKKGKYEGRGQEAPFPSTLHLRVRSVKQLSEWRITDEKER
jgi:hypothetical protein